MNKAAQPGRGAVRSTIVHPFRLSQPGGAASNHL
jgi:hypothetical protein